MVTGRYMSWEFSRVELQSHEYPKEEQHMWQKTWRALLGTASLLVGIGITPAITQAQTLSTSSHYTAGELVQYNHQPDVYVYQNQQLHWIPSAALFSALGHHWTQVHVLSSTAIRPPMGSPVQYVQVSGQSSVYWLQQGKAYLLPHTLTIPALPTPTQAHYPVPPAADIYAVSSLPTPIGTWPTGSQIPPSGRVFGTNGNDGFPIPGGPYLVRYAGSSMIYEYAAHEFFWIPNAATFHALGFQWSQVRFIPNHSAPNEPIGYPVAVVRQQGTSQVYVEAQGYLHWIPTAALFHVMGFHFNAQAGVSLGRTVRVVAHLPTLPVGNPVFSHHGVPQIP